MLIPSALTTWEQKMIDDTSFETHRQHETKDFILQLRRLIVEKDAEIERLKVLCARAAGALEADELTWDDYDKLVTELRKAAQ